MATETYFCANCGFAFTLGKVMVETVIKPGNKEVTFCPKCGQQEPEKLVVRKV